MAKVFVGSLPPTINDATLQQLFVNYGTIQQSMVNTEKRYGFVVYGNMQEAQAAIAAMNGFQLDGQSLVVKFANNQQQGGGPPGAGGGYGPAGGAAATPGERLYIKGLPGGCTDQFVRELFASYGTVTDVKVLVTDGKTNDGTGQSVAIIKMGSTTEADWLVANLNGNIPQGLTRPVEVSYAGAKPPMEGKGFSPYGKGAPQMQMQGMGMMGMGMPGGKGGFGKGPPEVTVPSVAAMKAQVGPNSTLYVKGLPPTADDAYVYRVFAPFGRILSAKALQKEHFCIGFVTYASDDEAQAGILSVNGQQLTDGTTLQVSVKVAKAAPGMM